MAKRYVDHGRTFAACTKGQLEIHTIEPRNLQAMLATSFEDFGLEPLRKTMADAFWGRGILTTDGAFWKHCRALIRPTFKRTEVGNAGLFQPHIDRLLHIVSEQNENSDCIDLEPILLRYALDTSTHFLFGESASTQDSEPPEEGQDFLKAYESISLSIGKRRQQGQSKQWFWQRQRDGGTDEANEVVYDFIEKRIRKALAERQTMETNKGPRSSGAHRFILVNEIVERLNDVVAIRSQLLQLFMPASESTGTLVGSVMYTLAREPAIWAKLRSEVLEIFGFGQVSYEQVKSLRYMRFVIQETLRLFPPIIANKRVALRETSLPLGGGAHGDAPIQVRKGTVVNTSFYALHRDIGLWGADASVFRPERWETERPDWRYLPFHGGPRICIAQQYVLTEASYVLVAFLQRFQKIEACDDEPWTEALKFTMRSKHGVKVRLTPARQNQT